MTWRARVAPAEAGQACDSLRGLLSALLAALAASKCAALTMAATHGDSWRMHWGVDTAAIRRGAGRPSTDVMFLRGDVSPTVRAETVSRKAFPRVVGSRAGLVVHEGCIWRCYEHLTWQAV